MPCTPGIRVFTYDCIAWPKDGWFGAGEFGPWGTEDWDVDDYYHPILEGDL